MPRCHVARLVANTLLLKNRQQNGVYKCLHSQVIDFACDFGLRTSGKVGSGHYRKGYPRQSVENKGMVISRDDGILILDKSLSDLSGVEVRVIGQIADRKRIPHSALHSQVIDFACDFGFSTSGKAGGGHYRKGYPRQSVENLLQR